MSITHASRDILFILASSGRPRSWVSLSNMELNSERRSFSRLFLRLRRVSSLSNVFSPLVSEDLRSTELGLRERFAPVVFAGITGELIIGLALMILESILSALRRASSGTELDGAKGGFGLAFTLRLDAATCLVIIASACFVTTAPGVTVEEDNDEAEDSVEDAVENFFGNLVDDVAFKGSANAFCVTEPLLGARNTAEDVVVLVVVGLSLLKLLGTTLSFAFISATEFLAKRPLKSISAAGREPSPDESNTADCKSVVRSGAVAFLPSLFCGLKLLTRAAKFGLPAVGEDPKLCVPEAKALVMAKDPRASGSRNVPPSCC